MKMMKKSILGLVAMASLALAFGPNAHAFTFMNCRSGDQAVQVNMFFSGHALVSTNMAIQGQKIELAATTIQPNHYPEHDFGKPMDVQFVGYLVTLAADNATASVSADGSLLMTLNCCDPIFPQCQSVDANSANEF